MIAAIPGLPEHHVLRPTQADGREASIWHWRPGLAARGTIVFSHGAQSAPWKYAALIARWLEDGYEVWAPWHVDSTDHPLNAQYPGLLTWKARIEDMRAASALVGGPYVAAGHSYGALTALVQGGASGDIPAGIQGDLRDPAVQCVVALSPPPPIPGLITPEGYGTLAVPALVQTGSQDVFPGDPFTPDAWRVHLPAYEAAAPGGNRYLLLLDGVDHTFGNLICDIDRDAPPQTEQLEATLTIVSLFIDAHYGAPADASRSALTARLCETGDVRLATR